MKWGQNSLHIIKCVPKFDFESPASQNKENMTSCIIFCLWENDVLEEIRILNTHIVISVINFS